MSVASGILLKINAGRTELAVAGVVLAVLALLATVASPARATLWMEALMLGGALLLAVAQLASSWLFSLGPVGGIVWSICSGSGIFLGYVPIGAMFYDRLIGALRYPATAVFMINVSDSAGCKRSMSSLVCCPR